MKHLKVFLTHNDYLDFTETSDYVLPNVSYCINNSEDALVPKSHPDVHYNPQLRVTYRIDKALFVANTKLHVTDPVPEPIVIINSSKSLSDYVKDITYMGYTIPAELFEEHPISFSIGEHTLLLTLKDVALISSDMFSGCTQITKVVIPDSVNTISSGAFNGCTGLKTIDIGKVTIIDNSSFCFCNNLSESSIELINRINSGALNCNI